MNSARIESYLKINSILDIQFVQFMWLLWYCHGRWQSLAIELVCSSHKKILTHVVFRALLHKDVR